MIRRWNRLVHALVVLAAVVGLIAVCAPPALAEFPCCNITSINLASGVVTAKVNATGQQFQVRLSNSAQLRSLKVGQGIYANLATKQVSLDGQHRAGQIVGIGPAATAKGSRASAATPFSATASAASGRTVRAPTTSSSPSGSTGHIVSVSSGVADVQVDGTSEQLQFDPRPQDVPYLLPSQKVWIKNVLIKQGVAPPFETGKNPNTNLTVLYLSWPQSLEQKHNCGHSHYMRTKIVISSTGRIDGTTETWSSEEFRGFTGGVKIFLYSDQCNSQGDCDVLYSSPSHRYGVNGHSMGNSRRTDMWTEPVSTAVLAQTRHIKIVQIASPEDRLDKFLEEAKKVSDIAVPVAKAIAGAAAGGGGGGH